MARVKRGVTAHARHKKVLEARQGLSRPRQTAFRVAHRAVEKALQYAYRDRRNKKRDFRGLWIQRINAAAREHGLTYSQFMTASKKAGIEIDRKVLADIAIREPAAFTALVEQAQAALEVAVRKRLSRRAGSRNSQGGRPGAQAPFFVSSSSDGMSDLATIRSDGTRPRRVGRAADLRALDAVRVAALGKNGSVTGLLKTLGDARARAAQGARASAQPAQGRGRRRDRGAPRRARGAAELDARLAAERVDVTLPPRPRATGRIHPISQTIDEIVAIFGEMGFTVAEGPGHRGRLLQFHRAQHPARASGAADARHLLSARSAPTARRWCCARTPRRCRSAPC